MSGPPRKSSSRSAGGRDAPAANSRSDMKPYQPGSPVEPGPAELEDPRPHGGRHDRGQGVVGQVPGRVDQLAPDRPPRPLRVRDDPQPVGGDLGPDVVRAALRVPVELDLEERPADVEHHARRSGPAGHRAARRPRPASAAARRARRRPSRGRRPCPRGTRSRRPAIRGRPAASGPPPSAARGRSRAAARRGCPGPPSAYVAKTHGGRGVHGPVAG